MLNEMTMMVVVADSSASWGLQPALKEGGQVPRLPWPDEFIVTCLYLMDV